MSDFDHNNDSEMSSLVVARLDAVHIKLEHLCEKIDNMAADHKDLEGRLRILEVQAAQMPLKIALLAAGTGLLGGGGAGAIIKAIVGGG